MIERTVSSVVSADVDLASPDDLALGTVMDAGGRISVAVINVHLSG